MSKFFKKNHALKGASLAMGIVASFFAPASNAYPQQKDVLQVISQVKTASAYLHSQLEQQPNAIFSELSGLTQSVSLLNAVARSMSAPEKVVDEVLLIQAVLEKLSEDLRTTYYLHLRENPEDRTIFKNYRNEVFNFSVFATKLRQKTERYTIVQSLGKPTQADLDALVAYSNKGDDVNA